MGPGDRSNKSLEVINMSRIEKQHHLLWTLTQAVLDPSNGVRKPNSVAKENLFRWKHKHIQNRTILKSQIKAEMGSLKEFYSIIIEIIERGLL